MDIKQLELELQEMVKDNPQLQEYQNKIDSLLDKSPDRMATLRFLLEENIQELREQLTQLEKLMQDKK